MLATINCADLTITFRPDPANPLDSLRLARERAERVATALRDHPNAGLYDVTHSGGFVALVSRDDDGSIEAFADVVSAQIGAAKLTEALNSDGMQAVVEV